MNPNTLVALPPITAAQRQTLIAALEHAHKHGYQRVVEVAQALDLHRDAVPVPEHDGQGACDVHPGIHAFRNDPDACIGWVDVPMTPSDPVLQCDAVRATAPAQEDPARAYLLGRTARKATPGTEHPCSVEGCDNSATTHGTTCLVHR